MNLLDRIYTGTTNPNDVKLFLLIIMACSLLGLWAGCAIGAYK